MHSTILRATLAAFALFTIACGERDRVSADAGTAPVMTPGEVAGTSGTNDQLITVSGCVTKSAPDGFVLTSSDEALLRRETGTTGHHRDDPDTAPDDANRGAENERLRHTQNPSAELGRYRLEGDAERIAMNVNREVEIQGRVTRTDGENSTPAALKVESIDATGPRCGN